MDLNRLLIFAKVAEHQSFTQAAQELGIEKSTVSSKVSQLEKHLGIRLLNRTTRLVTLTEAGEAYFQYCKQIVETAQEAESFAETLTDEPQGVLRISVPMDFGQLLVSQLIKPFMSTYPELKIDLNVVDREVDLIAERFDIALRIGPGTLKDSSLIGKKLFDIRMGLFASPDYIKEHGEPASADDLSSYPFIIFTKEQLPVFKFAKDFAGSLSENSSGNIKINDVITCKEAARAGLGIAILPVAIAQHEVGTGKLIALLPELKIESPTLFAVYPSRQWAPSKLKVFLQHVESWQH